MNQILLEKFFQHWTSNKKSHWKVGGFLFDYKCHSFYIYEREQRLVLFTSTQSVNWNYRLTCDKQVDRNVLSPDEFVLHSSSIRIKIPYRVIINADDELRKVGAKFSKSLTFFMAVGDFIVFQTIYNKIRMKFKKYSNEER